MNRLNIAVIGAGYWGKKVIAQILDIARTGEEINLYSVADSSPIALEQCRKEFGPLNYRLDYRELLSDPKVSAVHLCSPKDRKSTRLNSSHANISYAVFCLKKKI